MSTVNYVNISGGKDSTATLLLAIERGVENLRAVMADTGHEHPLTYEYVDYLERATGVEIRRVKACFKMRIANKREYIMKKWLSDGVPQERIDRAMEVLVPTGNPFLDLCLWKGRFPSTRRRFCTEELKVLPMMQYVFIPATREFDEVVSWQGVRRDESRARANLPEKDEGEFGVINYRPILDWKAEDCFEMHRKHGIKWNPLYEQGMRRVGCMPCIHAGKQELREIAKRYPGEFERVATWERLVSDGSKRGASTFIDGRIAARFTGDDDIRPETHGIHVIQQWAMTSRGGKQADLIHSIEAEEPPMCSSQYGLCE